MCGHIGLLVNFVFSLTRIFHGNAGGMSSGHTWHWGTPERSHQIPLGKPGLVIPRCETLASRSVTFPLHQSRVQHCTPSPLPCHEDLQLRVQRGERKKKKSAKQRRRRTLAPLAQQQQQSSKERKKKISDYPSPSSGSTWDSSNAAGAHRHILTVRWEALCCITTICYAPYKATREDCEKLQFEDHHRNLGSSII